MLDRRRQCNGSRSLWTYCGPRQALRNQIIPRKQRIDLALFMAGSDG